MANVTDRFPPIDRVGRECGAEEPPTATLGGSVGGTAAPTTPASIIADRYEVGELVGRGGMGRVHRAFDRVLQRDVALKLIRRDGSLPAERLLREARAQGRVDHDNVCRVYDAGESGEHVYIAMHLIGGVTLNRAAWSLTLTEKLGIVAQAAEGVHAAHRCGLVHGDLKPGNIMLARRTDGGWKAWVVDFGLVRDLDAAASMVQGVAGTPYYMAPEQVRGAAERTDWRADVWALGVTLFELAVGRRPFDTGSSLEVLVRVLEDEVRFPSLPRLPRDLRAIIGRCLEKEPERRYGTARELADDLKRHLAGLPVAALPTSALRRLGKSARRHPRLATAAATAAAALLALAGLLAHTTLRGREQAALARRFGEEAAVLESLARYSAMLPAHDVRPERAEVRRRIDDIARQAGEIGALATGPAAYAQGRGWLALGDAVKAREQLESAWAAGYRQPDVAAALGQALAMTFQQRLYEARGISSAELRQSRERQLARTLRDPALARLLDGAGATATSPAYVTALIALIEERWDDAVAGARAAAAGRPWLYEAHRLEGETWLARALALANSGELTGAGRALAAAGAAFARAAAVARSDPASRAGECARHLRLLKLAVATGGSPEPFLPRVREAAETALAIDPDDVAPRCDMATAYVDVASYRLGSGQDAAAAADAAVAEAEAALQCDPRSARAHTVLAQACSLQAERARKGGREGREWAAKAVAAYDEALALDPFAAQVHSFRATALRSAAQEEREFGRDPRPLLAEAARGAEAAIAIDPTLASAHYASAVISWSEADWAERHGDDPRPALQAAIVGYRTALGLNPALKPAPSAIGVAYDALATAAAAVGEDPTPARREAERWFARSIELYPGYSTAYFNAVRLLDAMGRDALERGQDAAPIAERARRMAAAAVAADPADAGNFNQVARAELLAARVALVRSEPVEVFLTAADAALARSRALNPASGLVHIYTAKVHALRAEACVKTGCRWRGEVEAGLRALAEAQRAIPTSGEVRELRARLHLQRARESAGTERERAARAALAALADALTINPNIATELGELRAEAERLLATPAT
jgi:serine/threonine-protein kinase